MPSPFIATLDTLALLVMAFAAAAATLRIGAEGGLLPVSGPRRRARPAPAVAIEAPLLPEPAPEPDAFETRLAADLDRLMTADRVYRVDDLTLGMLALKLSVPGYRLRRFIHQRHGQRNFNAYVNPVNGRPLQELFRQILSQVVRSR